MEGIFVLFLSHDTSSCGDAVVTGSSRKDPMLRRIHTTHIDAQYLASSSPEIDDLILVQRSTLIRLQAHIAAEQERFPSRRLRQAIQIVQGLLSSRSSLTHGGE